MTTAEEALTTGWLTPTPTFFTEDQLTWARKCHASPWVVVRKTVPRLKAIPRPGEEPRMIELRERVLAPPLVMPEPRPFMYMRFAEYR